ncbi:MAG: response regulator [Desulfobacteraceae bacterium]|nr:response regulator [Desulfobacteraceae bacterium]
MHYREKRKFDVKKPVAQTEHAGTQQDGTRDEGASEVNEYSSQVAPGRASIKRILVMDDEPMLRDIIGRMLSRIGHEVDFAKDGAEAIGLYERERESGEPFDAVILGLTDKCGGMGGMETIAKLRGIDPDVKALITTGFSGHPVLTHYRQYGFRGAFAKPFTMDELCKAVEEVLKG